MIEGKKRDSNEMRDSFSNIRDSEDNKPMTQLESEWFIQIKKSLIVKRQSFCQRMLNVLLNILLWSIGVCVSYLFALSSGFGYVELFSAVLCSLMLFVIILYFSYTTGLSSSRCMFVLCLFAILSSFLPTLFFQEICVC